MIRIKGAIKRAVVMNLLPATHLNFVKNQFFKVFSGRK